jgi:hypothetical protein
VKKRPSKRQHVVAIKTHPISLPKAHHSKWQLSDNPYGAGPIILPLAVAMRRTATRLLRQTLIEINSSRLVQQEQQTKMEQAYHYLTGMKFRRRSSKDHRGSGYCSLQM